MNEQVKKIAPRGEVLLRYVHENLLANARENKVARLVLPSLVSRAYNIVYETNDLLVRNLKKAPKLFKKG
jgi:hypothetical protein